MITGDDSRDLHLRATPHRTHAIWWTLFAILAILLVGAYAHGKLRSAIDVPPRPAAQNEDMPLSSNFEGTSGNWRRETVRLCLFRDLTKHHCWT